MRDESIVTLYWQRDETALQETEKAYGRYCYRIAYNILQNKEDSDESVNDAFLAAWHSIPPHKPTRLDAFLGKLTRRIAVSVWRHKHADKRGGELVQVLEELEECLPSSSAVEHETETKELAGIITEFVRQLPEAQRRVFVERYWYAESVASVAEHCGFSQSKVKSMLHRTRDKLKTRLQKEGY